MAGIKEPIKDVLTRLKTITVRSAEGYDVNLFARIWNNQIDRQDDGSGYVFQRPATFVEVLNAVQYEIIGLGFREADICFRVHLIHDYYNGDDFEQDLVIFDLRDKILLSLSQYCPTSCGTLNCVREEQEYDHDNTYHYILDFVCSFVDSKGSDYDTEKGIYIEETNTDNDLNLDVEFNIPQ
jgi:hypothetical protein